MGRKRNKPKTLLQLAVANGGLIKGYRAVGFILCWAIAEEMISHPPTLDEYREWWKESRATAFREQAIFRECFPGETTPQRIVDAIKVRRDEWREGGVKALGKLSVEIIGGAPA